ncbi:MULTISPECIES: ABC transporter ATP-binding protein [unclassified Mesorhizobium]|uniref:ABC transporter ATP-binding protein n=2 Tax=Mesorhizobium TaxID=68287 RepID=UPI000FCA6AB0|nr:MULTISPECIES: ABC transporter ATP-binding protein [unclassified Mesorhizobium]RUW37048.1 ABC transporter ATP-binding protein [Mesorhizobium sp. M1E.F.Ca.ET.041.01.1.1]RWB55434.1 MAG: ABC transporter ATP-binding protein [Mesorhizobium sp.]RWD90781.1 MAG: ABC transporter ATP-binding protein [Mesorhizobium sp.]RWD92054.1 MAG: ABC transporter ATP-binding protein [Mesorhizobium sp.]TIV55545.1 MAG: ATP-binding cassette domain-containing protein [Mesorhizobium sp.]
MLQTPRAAANTVFAEHGRVVFEAVSKAYGSVCAVDDVSFDIEPGSLVTLLGPSGCGKTTTLRMIAGLELPTHGRIVIGGRDVSMLPATYRNVAMVFQSYALFPHMSVIENVSYGLLMSGIRKTEARLKAEQALEMVGLAGYGARLPSELSGGQQQRVAVARAVVLEPEVLLLDEPLSNLDAKLRRLVRDEIRSLQQRLAVTTVYVTHDQEEAMAVSDAMVVMQSGRVAQQGTAAELYEHPRSSFIASFIGEANLLECEARQSRDGKWVAMIAGSEIAVSDAALLAGPAKLVVRPEALRLIQAEAYDGLVGEIESCAFLGDRILYRINSPIGLLYHTEYQAPIRNMDSRSVGLLLDPSKLKLVTD